MGRVPVDFSASPRPTVGVEWEFALVDRETRDLSNTAADLFAAVHEREASVIDESKLHQELLRNTVEVVTGICESVPEAVADLAGTVRVVRRTAAGARRRPLLGRHPPVRASGRSSS